MIFCLCLDTDWALPEITHAALELFAAAELPVTVLATEDQEVRAGDLVEVGWHPNFITDEPEAQLNLLARKFPGARGLRPHRLNMGTRIEPGLLRRYGLRWTSIASDHARRRPVPFQDGLPDVAITWGDGFWFRRGDRPSQTWFPSKEAGICVLNFHPIHIYLNTCSIAQYEQARACYHDLKALKRLRNDRRPGVAEVLAWTMNRIAESGARCTKISGALELLARPGGEGTTHGQHG